MLSAVLHERGIVLAQTPLDHLGEEEAAELTAAPALLAPPMLYSGRAGAA
jgi:hypothetical protein